MEKIVDFVNEIILYDKKISQFDLNSIFYNLKAQSKALALTVARYLKEERFSPKPSIRISVNIELTESEMDFIVSVLEQALKTV